ncbi:MAG: Ig-like domain-containing protein, partial [Verrucomicrobiales bacterium]|nr:Ig-like domain-containing protein [Verrucomicrobiales bacterium]
TNGNLALGTANHGTRDSVRVEGVLNLGTNRLVGPGTFTNTATGTLVASGTNLLASGLHTIQYGGALVITNMGVTLTGGEQLHYFNATNLITGSFASLDLPALATGLNWWTGRLVTHGRLVVNRAPVPGPASYSRGPGLPLKIKISDLMALSSDPDSSDGDSIAFDSVNSGDHGATVTTNATYIFYTLATHTNDTLVYTIKDQRGGSASTNIAIALVTPGGLAKAIDTSGGTVTVHFSGIPGYPYKVERADDVNFTVNLTVLLTTNAPANGQFSVTDTSPPMPTAYYRLKHNP